MSAGMVGKTVVITGGNSGIGLEAAVALASAGASVVIGARDPSRGAAAVATIRQRRGVRGEGDVSLVVFDLASLASVKAGALEILDRCPRIDVLINNAGVILGARQETPDGFEATFATNHLGPFFLTTLLLDRIVASAPSRIVNVSSMAHRSARLDFDDLQSNHRYSGMGAYSQSKLANIYFTTELARRLAGMGVTGVTVNCLHPGVVATGWAGGGDVSGPLGLGLKVARPFMLTAKRGARTSIYLASSPEVADVTGQYFVHRRPRALGPVAADALGAHLLWEASEALVAGAAGEAGQPGQAPQAPPESLGSPGQAGPA